jgi:hypothetical protein
VALNVALYELPSFAEPRLAEVMARFAASIVSDSGAEADCAGDSLSVTLTVKLDVPLAVGVPEMTPPLERVSPAGRLPEASDHVYAAVPPVALRVVLYELPTMPAPRLSERTARPEGRTVIDT